MRMPHYALVGELRMLAQKLERVGGGDGVVLLVGKRRRLSCSFILLTHPAVKDCEIVVGSEVIRSDLLQGFVLLQRVRVLVLLVQSEAQFTMRIARKRIL